EGLSRQPAQERQDRLQLIRRGPLGGPHCRFSDGGEMDKPLAISMGEPAGVGPDIILALYARRAELQLPPFCVFGHPEFFQARAQRLGLSVAVTTAAPADANTVFASSLPVVAVEGLVPDNPG